MLFRLYIFFRWVRLTTRRYGLVYLASVRRSRHAACGRAARIRWYVSAHGDVTGYNLMASDLIATLRAERAYRERFGLAA